MFANSLLHCYQQSLPERFCLVCSHCQRQSTGEIKNYQGHLAFVTTSALHLITWHLYFGHGHNILQPLLAINSDWMRRTSCEYHKFKISLQGQNNIWSRRFCYPLFLNFVPSAALFPLLLQWLLTTAHVSQLLMGILVNHHEAGSISVYDSEVLMTADESGNWSVTHWEKQLETCHSQP